MGAALAFALTLLASPASAQSARPSWIERAQGLDGCALQALVDEMDRKSAAIPHDDADFALAYHDATCVLINAELGGACRDEDLRTRVERARRVAGERGAVGAQLRVENEYAKTLLALGELSTAESVLLDARSRFSAAHNELAETLGLLVNLRQRAGRFDEGEAVALECERLLGALIDAERASKDEAWLGFHLSLLVHALGDHAQILLKLGLPDRAAALLERQQQASRECGEFERPNYSSIRVAMDRAVFAVAIQDFEDALASCEEVFSSSIDLRPDERLTLKSFQAAAIAQLALESRADVARASVVLHEMLAVKDLPANLRREALLRLAAIELQAKDFESARRRLAESSVEASRALVIDPGRRIELDQLWTMYRSRLAFESGEPSTVQHACLDDLERMCASMFARAAQVRARPGGIGYLHWGDPRLVLSERIRGELALDRSDAGKTRALEAVVRAQTLGSTGRAVGARHVTLAEIREHLLPPDVGLLVYLPTFERSHLFVIDATAITHVPLGTRNSLVESVRSFSEDALQRPEEGESAAERSSRDSRLRDRGRVLRELLLPDAALDAMRGWSGFYVNGADLIANPPFECLPLPADQLLGIEYAIAYLPSLPLGVWLARRAKERPDEPTRSKLLVLAGAGHSQDVVQRWPNLKPLVLSKRDRDDIASSFAPAQTRFLEAEDATRARLFEAEIDGVGVLELFTHGVYDPGQERPAGLVVSSDAQHAGVLTCDDIEQGPNSPALVALFACGSALGPARLGDDSAAQLGTCFFPKGADTVVLSRAKLAYGAMIELARAFHIEWQRTRGVSAAEALRRARRALSRSERWSDPFYFGHVSVLGLGWKTASARNTTEPIHEQPARSGMDASKAWLVIVGVPASLALFLFVKRVRANAARTRS